MFTLNSLNYTQKQTNPRLRRQSVPLNQIQEQPNIQVQDDDYYAQAESCFSSTSITQAYTQVQAYSLMESNTILKENQNRLPGKNEIQKRITIPKYNFLEFHNEINTNVSSCKTITSVLGTDYGFGDYLRGSILLAQCAKHFNTYFKMDLSFHPIYNCLNISETVKNNISSKPKIHSFSVNSNHKINDLLFSIIANFIQSDETNIFINTNLFYNTNLVSTDIKKYINYTLTFKPKYYHIVNELFKLNNYNVLHIRCKDDNFNTNFNDDNLLEEIIKLQLGPNTIVMSNNYTLKQTIHRLFGFYFIDKNSYHSAHTNDFNNLDSTIIEYIILSKSSYTYCFSYYQHGSGFSEQCSILNDIPYQVVFLPTDIVYKSDHRLLLNHYNNLLFQVYIENNKISRLYRIDDYNSIEFITLSESKYIHYTLNCIQSLKNINVHPPLKVFSTSSDAYSRLKSNYHLCELINDDNTINSQSTIIYNHLLHNKYVCITNGFTVYENTRVFDYLLDKIQDNDLLIQSSGIYDNDLCSGFMFIQSNDNTISLFNPENVKKYMNTYDCDIQVYINTIKHKLKYKKLPLQLFPTGTYYYQYHNNIQPYMIHFNGIIDNEPKSIMEKFDKWYVSKKLTICQYEIECFGNHLDGMLQLLSSKLNNKCDYQYGLNRISSLGNLQNYLIEGLKNISNSEEILFIKDEILRSKKNVRGIIYCYDNVSNIIDVNKLQSNNKLSLPKLREAFVLKNNNLPTKSYNDEKINVCCHINDDINIDTENLFKIINEFQKYDKYRVIIYADTDVTHLQSENTIIYDANTDVLQTLSDFIYAEILIMSDSSLSIAAHILANQKQNVLYSKNIGSSNKYKILNKCILVEDAMGLCYNKIK